MGSLEEAFSRSAVMDLAGPDVYWRGLAYFDEGRVEAEEREGDRLRATVQGSVPYTVELWVERGSPEWSCTCPYAEDGSCCKHAVAVTLLLAGKVPTPPPTAEEARATARERDRLLAEYVGGLDRERLVELVVGSAGQDWRLRERLLAEARADRGEGPDLSAWRDRIDAAFMPYDDLVTYQEAPSWAAEVQEVIDALAELCDAGHPDAVIVLAEHAHRRADEAIGYVDSSDGWLTVLSERLAELHHSACVDGEPDPVELARRLADLVHVRAGRLPPRARAWRRSPAGRGRPRSSTTSSPDSYAGGGTRRPPWRCTGTPSSGHRRWPPTGGSSPRRATPPACSRTVPS